MFLFNLGVANSKLHDMEPYCLLVCEHNRETIIIEDITEEWNLNDDPEGLYYELEEMEIRTVRRLRACSQ